MEFATHLLVIGILMFFIFHFFIKRLFSEKFCDLCYGPLAKDYWVWTKGKKSIVLCNKCNSKEMLEFKKLSTLRKKKDDIEK